MKSRGSSKGGRKRVRVKVPGGKEETFTMEQANKVVALFDALLATLKTRGDHR